MERVRRILIPVAAHEEDGVDLARHAALRARPALSDEATVHLVAAVPALSDAGAGAANAMREVLRARNEHIHGRMIEFADELKQLGLTVEVHLHESDDHPGQVIADQARELGCEWIAMPTHARTGIQRMFLGSVANRVIQTAHVPVLLVR